MTIIVWLPWPISDTNSKETKNNMKTKSGKWKSWNWLEPHKWSGCIVALFATRLKEILCLTSRTAVTCNRWGGLILHWIITQFVFLFSVVCIVLALGPGNTRPFIGGTTSYTFWIMVVFLAFHVLFWIGLEIWTCSKTGMQLRVYTRALSESSSI